MREHRRMIRAQRKRPSLAGRAAVLETNERALPTATSPEHVRLLISRRNHRARFIRH